MRSRAAAATVMAFRDEGRRPLLLVLLVVVPIYVITRSIATTEGTPRRIELPGGMEVVTTMKALHGAVMAGSTIAFVVSLVGVFVMQAALAGDRRLVIAGYRPGETILARLAVLGVATALVVAVSAGITAVHFTPVSWPPFLVALMLTGLIYGAIGALAGAVLDRLATTYLMLFLAMTDLGIVQNPMFGDGKPDGWAILLPGYGPGRMMVDGAFSPSFHAAPALVVGLAWTAMLVLLVTVVLTRAVAIRS